MLRMPKPNAIGKRKLVAVLSDPWSEATDPSVAYARMVPVVGLATTMF